VRRALYCLTIVGILVGCLAASAAAGWVWRDGRWIYVDTTEPPLPSVGDLPKPPPPPPDAPKVATPSPSSAATTTPTATAPSMPGLDVPPPPPPPPPAFTTPSPTPAPPDVPTTAPPSKSATSTERRAKDPTRLTPPEGNSRNDQSPYSWGGVRKAPDPYGDKPLFQEGNTAYVAKNFKAAGNSFEKLIKDYPSSSYREEAMWLRSLSLVEIKELYAAYTQLDDLITGYAGSPHYHDALVKEMEIGDRFLAGEHRRVWGMPLMVGAESEGLEILRRVYEHQPASGLADEVVMKIAEYHWTHRQWQDAEDYYDKYCREFPSGKSAQRAELQRARCAIERCRGPRYDVTCLQLAIDRLKQFQQKFPDAAVQEGVPDLLITIRDEQAQAMYEIAARYYRGGQPLAAAHYAEKLREKYPDSPWSASAGRFIGIASPPAPEPAMEEPSK
jgi:outer membrane protein assembly factor BamD (BamD/ComL family)